MAAVAPESESVSSGWAERAADRSPQVQRSRARSIRQARVVVDAARRLIESQGEFTTQELAKEAGVALQTFYRYFGSKDELLVAVIEDLIGEQSRVLEAGAAGLDDPVARLHSFVTWPILQLGPPGALGAARLITGEHWRLHQVFPDAMARASQPFVDLVARTLRAALDVGAATPTDPERDARLVVDVVRNAFHHYAFVTPDRPLDAIADHVWSFCARAVGITPSVAA